MRNFQKIPILLQTLTTTMAAARQDFVVSLKEKLLPKVRGGINHVFGFLIEQDLDPSFTTAPTQLGAALALYNLKVQAEKGHYMFDGSGADLRAIEAYERGGPLLFPDGDLNGGTGTNFYSARYLSCTPGGPRGMSEGEEAFAIPAVLFDDAALQVQVGALTDVSADTTAATVVHRIYALCHGLDRVNIPPRVERKVWPCAGNERSLNDRARYLCAFMLNSTAHDAITAGDFSTFTADDRAGNFMAGVYATVLGRLYNAEKYQGQFGIIQGEPGAATDDNLKVVNGASPTAIASPTAAYQPLLWPVENQGIDNIEIEGPLTFRWSGSQATGSLITTRLLPRSRDEVKELGTRLTKSLSIEMQDFVPSGGKGREMDNPEYSPWVLHYSR